jgi:WD40 repeat protein
MSDPALTCPSARELEAMLDEALAGPGRQAVAEHVGGCPACQEALERLTGADSLSCPSLPSAPSLLARKPPAADAAGKDFLDRLKHAAPPEGRGPRPGVFPTLPGYQILHELGRGGMGVVYKARQTSLKRLVALKMILAGAHAGGKDLARFRHEAEAVARLRHPNIIQIYDIGESEGRPYLALEYVGDDSLARRLHGDPQPVAPAVALVETLARAVHFAHQHHVVHRDLKPANILLQRKAEVRSPKSEGAGPPFGFGMSDSDFSLEDYEPKMTDFGLAKRLDEQSSKTQSGEVVGTPSYMAPEQAAGKGRLVGPATDVYSLGAILYELLTGRPPFKGAAPVDTLVQVVHEEPLRPGRLRPGLQPDLETVCLKCLEKDPARRYASAEALADDLRRFREGKPVLARPVGAAERAWKWARHRPLTASLLAAVVLSTLLGLAGVTWQWRSAARAWEDAEDARARAALDRAKVQAALYYSLIAQAQLQWRVSDPASAERTLAECLPAPGHRDRRGWEWHYLQGLFHADLLTLRHAARGPGAGVAYHPGGRWLASVVGGHAGPAGPETVEVRFWDALTGVVLRSRPCPAAVHRLAVRPDGKSLALGAADGTVLVWDLPRGRERLRLRAHDRAVMGLAWGPTGGRGGVTPPLLATAGWDGTVKVWDAQAGRLLHTLTGHGAQVQAVAFHPDGGQLASAGWDETVKVWDARTGKLLRNLTGHRSAVYGVAYSPDGRLLASAGKNGNIKVWDVDTGRVVQSLTGHSGSVLGVAFSPDGRYLAYGAGDSTVRVWDVEDGVQRITFRGHTDAVEGICFSPDGQRLASVSPGQAAVKVWDLTRHPEHGTFARAGPGPDIEALAFRAGGKALVSVTAGGKLQIWDATTGVLEVEHALPVTGPLASPALVASFDGGAKRLAARAGPDGRLVKVWDVATGADLFTFRGHALPVSCVRFSGDGRLLATCASDPAPTPRPSEIRVWDAHTGLPKARLAGRGPFFTAAFSPDGRWLALGGRAGRLTLVGCEGRPRLVEVAGHRGNVTAVAFDPGGEHLVSAGQGEGALKVWRLAALTAGGGAAEPVATLAAPYNLYDLTFSPDGTRLAGISRDLVKLWDVEAGHEVLTLRGAPQRHWDPPFNPRLAFSPDGTRLAGTNWDESISLWSADDRGWAPGAAGAQVQRRRADRRRAADRRALFWHLQEAEHCLEHKNVSAARFHYQRLGNAPLPGPLQARKERLTALLAGPPRRGP